ncbi:MAG: F0F1 ATP synthase subunit alpha, partial [bacterium]
PQYEDQSFNEIAAIIFAAANGLLNEIPVADIKRYEKQFLTFLKERHPEILKTIFDTADLSDETQTKLKETVADFSANYWNK